MHTFEMSARAGGLLLRLSTRLQPSVTLEAPAITAGIKDISGFRGYHKNVRCIRDKGGWSTRVWTLDNDCCSRFLCNASLALWNRNI